MTINKMGISVFTRIIIFLAFVVSIIFCIHIALSENLTSRESALVGLVVAILSILASWIITHLYSESQQRSAIAEVQEQHKNNLRVYALKAAEKVNNLSNELSKLSLYLEEELNYIDYHSPEEELQAKEERIESTIHILRTLKSMNDTSLSDWEGVIGEELDQQREERQEKEEELKSLIDRVESVMEGQRQDALGTQRNAESLRAEIGILKAELRTALSQLSGTTIPKRLLKQSNKQTIENKCPSCGTAIVYRQKPSSTSVKSVVCPGCEKKLISRYSEVDGFKLEIREPELVKYTCQNCGAESSALLDVLPYASVLIKCSSCNSSIRLIRKPDGIDLRYSAPTEKPIERVLSKEVLDLIKNKLPPQPWPIGIHKEVSVKLGLPSGLVWGAIDKLIKRGDFLPQHNGKLRVSDAEHSEATKQ